MNFRVGQLVRVTWSPEASRIGLVSRIASPLRRLRSPAGRFWPEDFDGEPAHELAEPALYMPNKLAVYPVRFLEPYHEPGDYQTLSELLRGVVPAVKENA